VAGLISGGEHITLRPAKRKGNRGLFLFLFFLFMYSLLKYKKPRGALAMA